MARKLPLELAIMQAKQIASGLAGWLHFQHRCGRVEFFQERFTYIPIYELAQAKSFIVFHEAPCSSNRRRKIDFVFLQRNKRYSFAFEVKFIQEETNQIYHLENDIEKIDDFTNEVPQYFPRTEYEIPRFGFLLLIHDNDKLPAHRVRGRGLEDLINKAEENFIGGSSRLKADMSWKMCLKTLQTNFSVYLIRP